MITILQNTGVITAPATVSPSLTTIPSSPSQHHDLCRGPSHDQYVSWGIPVRVDENLWMNVGVGEHRKDRRAGLGYSQMLG